MVRDLLCSGPEIELRRRGSGSSATDHERTIVANAETGS